MYACLIFSFSKDLYISISALSVSLVVFSSETIKLVLHRLLHVCILKSVSMNFTDNRAILKHLKHVLVLLFFFFKVEVCKNGSNKILSPFVA